jgi:hypothetical protein
VITVDEPEDTVLSNYTIPRSLGQYDNEIMEVYYGWESKQINMTDLMRNL